MGVPVKKNADGVEEEGHELPPMPGTPLADADLADKNKKRKR
jgi:hypothetical protein